MTISLITHPVSRARAVALAVMVAFCGSAIGSDAPPSPGFYKLKLGSATVVALSDGSFSLPASGLMVEVHKGEVQAALANAHASDSVPTSVNAYLVDTGRRRVLIDTGSGSFLGPSLGEVEKHLEDAGYKASQIDEILITHLHADHIGGLVANGSMVYPNATIRVDAGELEFWEDRANSSKVDASVQATFDAVATALKPYEAVGHVKTLHAGESIEPGITAVAEPGHTLGHTGYRINSHGEVLVVWGDLVHLAVAQFPDPKVTIRFDSTPAIAVTTRERALAAAAKGGYLVAAAHIAFPGIGKVTKSASSYKWTPVTP